VKVQYDPTSATENQPRRGRLLFMSSDEEETPRAPTPPFKKNPSSTIEKKKDCGRSYTNEKGNLSFISSSRSKLLSVSTDEEKTTRDPNPPLVVKKGTSAKGEKNDTRRPHPKEKKNRSSNSSSRSKLLPESSDEEETTRDHNPPLTVKKALSTQGKKMILESHIRKKLKKKRKIRCPCLLGVVKCCQCQPMKKKPLGLPLRHLRKSLSHYCRKKKRFWKTIYERNDRFVIHLLFTQQ
jgi:hypothetical protein